MLGNGVRIAEAIINIKARTQPARDEIDKLGEKMDKLRAKIAAVTFSKGIGLSAVLDGMDNLVYKVNKAAKATLKFTNDASRDFDRVGAAMRRAAHGMDNFLNPSRVITGVGGIDRAIQRVHASLRAITLGKINFGNVLGVLSQTYGVQLSRVFARLGRSNPMQSLFVSLMRNSQLFRALPLPFRYAVEAMARDADSSFGRIGVALRAMAINPNIFGFITRINALHGTINNIFGAATRSRFNDYAAFVTGFFNRMSARFTAFAGSFRNVIPRIGANATTSLRNFAASGLMMVGMMRTMGNIGTVPIAVMTRFFSAIFANAPRVAAAANSINSALATVVGAIGSMIGGIGFGAGFVIRGIGAAFAFAAGAVRVFGAALSVGASLMGIFVSVVRTLLNALKAVWNIFYSLVSAVAAFVESIASAVFQVAGMVLKFAGVTMAVITGLAVAAVKKAADIQIAYQELGRVASLAGEDVLRLRDAIVAVGTTSAGTGSIKDLFELANFGARMGIGEGLEGSLKVKALENFTKSIARVRMALTDIPTEEAATHIVRILRVFGLGPEYIDNFASALVKLDNSSTATGRDILDLTRRLSGVLSTLGAMPYEVMGLAAAMRDAGVEVEVGGTAMSQLFIKTAYKTREYAKALKLPFQELEHAINTKPIEALKMVLQAIGKFSPVDQLRVLSKMQLQGRQTSSVILQMANNWKLIDSFMSEGADEWKSQNSLIEAANVRSRQFYSILEQSTNKLTALAAKVGDMLMPAATAMVEFFGVALDAASNFFEANRSQIEGWVAAVENGVATAKQYLIAGFQPFYDFMSEKWSEFMAKMTASWENSWDWLKTNWMSLAEWMGGTLMTMFDRVIGHLVDKMPLIGKAVQSAFAGFFKVINTAAGFIDEQQNYEQVPGTVSVGGVANRMSNMVNRAVGTTLDALLLPAGMMSGVGWIDYFNSEGSYFQNAGKVRNVQNRNILPPPPKGDVDAPFPKFPEFAKPEWLQKMTNPKLVKQAQEKAEELSAREYQDAVKKTAGDLFARSMKRQDLADTYWARGNKIMYEAQVAHAQKEQELAKKVLSGEYSLDVAKKFYGAILQGAPMGEGSAEGLPKGFIAKPSLAPSMDMNPLANSLAFVAETAKWHSMQASLAKKGLDNETLMNKQKEDSQRRAKAALDDYDKSLHRIAASSKERAFLDENLKRVMSGQSALTRKQYEANRKRKSVDDDKVDRKSPMFAKFQDPKTAMAEAAKLEKEAMTDLKEGRTSAYREKLAMARSMRATHVPLSIADRMQRRTLKGNSTLTKRQLAQKNSKKRQVLLSNDNTATKLKEITGMVLGTVDARAKIFKEKGGSADTEANAMDLARKLVDEFKQGDVMTISKLLGEFGNEQNLTEKIAMLLRETPEDSETRGREHMRKGGSGVFDPFSDEMMNMHSKSAGDFTGLVEFSRKLQSSALAKEDIPKKQLKMLEQIAENTGADNPAHMQINNFGGAVAQ